MNMLCAFGFCSPANEKQATFTSPDLYGSPIVRHWLVEDCAQLVSSRIANIGDVESRCVVKAEPRYAFVLASVCERSGIECVHGPPGWRMKGNVDAIAEGRLTSVVGL